jgi:phosphatidylserine/phosphatidylglycerophosphate/cardiolipin synthase-like enzyme
MSERRRACAADWGWNRCQPDWIVVDQQQVFVSSANFTEAPQERNLEIGLRIDSASLAEKLTRHFDTLLADRLLQATPLCLFKASPITQASKSW